MNLRELMSHYSLRQEDRAKGDSEDIHTRMFRLGSSAASERVNEEMAALLAAYRGKIM